MKIIISKICECVLCGWIGSYTEVKSMAGFEFCPACNCRYTGFMHGHYAGKLEEVKP